MDQTLRSKGCRRRRLQMDMMKMKTQKTNSHTSNATQHVEQCLSGPRTKQQKPNPKVGLPTSQLPGKGSRLLSLLGLLLMVMAGPAPLHDKLQGGVSTYTLLCKHCARW